MAKNKMRHVGMKSFATMWAAGTIAAATFLPGSLRGNLRDAYQYFSHSGETASEMVRGTRGEGAVRDLEEALSIVGDAAGRYDVAGEGLDNYLEKTRDLVEDLRRTYDENEDVIRESKRLYVQFTGMMSKLGDIGNSLKPDFMKSIDEGIIKLYGMDPVEAKERSAKVREFYDEALEFYNSREKNEDSLEAFADYLAKKPKQLEAQNNRINEILGNLEGTLEETYVVEDRVFEEAPVVTDLITGGNPEKIGVEDYGSNVDSVREEVEEFTPVPDRGYDWISFLFNPAILGLGFAGLGRMGIEGFLPGPLKRAVNRTIALPAHAVTSGIRKGYGVAKKTKKSSKKVGSMENANSYKPNGSSEPVQERMIHGK